MRSALYPGTLVHVRRTPTEHVFRYPVCFFALDLDALERLDGGLRLFSHNRANVVSLRDRDYLGSRGKPLRETVHEWLGARGVEAEGPVRLVTIPRVLGYTFNPVSFFYCSRADGSLAAAIAEVSNTFGERWPYLLLPGDDGELRVETEKRLHVSPFFALEQRYRFALCEPGERLWARIDVYEGETRRFGSVLAGERRELTDASLARVLVRYGHMPARVTRAIHWQALRLWVKRVPFHHKPSPPEGTLPVPHAIRLPRPGRLQP